MLGASSHMPVFAQWRCMHCSGPSTADTVVYIYIIEMELLLVINSRI